MAYLLLLINVLWIRRDYQLAQCRIFFDYRLQFFCGDWGVVTLEVNGNEKTLV